MKRSQIYMDYMASTPCDPVVVSKMVRYLTGGQGNPSSAHWAGSESAAAVETARAVLADAIGCFTEELIFTSGATESNNIALLGALRVAAPGRSKVVTFATEHHAVLGPCRQLAREGHKVAVCPVHADGRADLAVTAKEITREVAVVSVQMVNNEIGTIQPVREIAQLAHAQGAIVHVDAAQALGKIPVDVDELDGDLVSLSAHKCYGPKGVGALYVRGGASGGLIEPLMFGGGQQRELRPGTENVAGIVGFGEAALISQSVMDAETELIAKYRDCLEAELGKALPALRVNGAITDRVAGCSSFTIPGVDAEALIANVPEIALSSSSACHAGAPEPSHVLLAIGLTPAEAYATVRVGIGRFTSWDEVEHAIARIPAAAKKLIGLVEQLE